MNNQAIEDALTSNYSQLYLGSNYLKSLSFGTYTASIGESNEVGNNYMYHVFFNMNPFNNENTYDNLDFLIEHGKIASNLLIDSEIIRSDEYVNFLRRMVDRGLVNSVTIINNDYNLTSEDYDRIYFIPNIVVAHAANDVYPLTNQVIETRGIYSYDVSPSFNDFNVLENSFNIDHELNDDEIKFLVQRANEINNGNNVTINFKLHNAGIYRRFAEKLHNAGLNENINLSFIGFPLNDQSNIFENINRNIPNKVNIVYTCCHDMLDFYARPPFASNNFHSSELEPGAITDLDTYTRMLKFVEKFQNDSRYYTNDLDKVVSAYNYLNEHYSYDEDADNKDYSATRDVNKIFDKDKIVCVGFSNLLTIMLRRAHVDCLTYEVDNHQRNIARIKNTDENGNIIEDKICVLDPTWDCGQNNDNSRFTFFGLSPDMFLRSHDPEFLSIASSLVLNKDDINLWQYISTGANSYLRSNGHTSVGYAITLLRLFGYDINNIGFDNFSDYCAELIENDRIGTISSDEIINSFRRVYTHEHPEYNDIEEKEKQIRESIDERNSRFDLPADLINLNIYRLFNPNPNDVYDGYAFVNPMTRSLPNHVHYELNEIDTLADTERDIIVDTEVEEHTDTEAITEDTSEVTEEVIIEHTDEVTEDIVIQTDNSTGTVVSESVDDTEINRYIEMLIYKFNNNERNITPLDTLALYYLETHPDLPVSIEYRERLLNWFGINDNELEPVEISENVIAGTTIRQPRERDIYETDEEYEEYLRRYYDEYFPEARAETREVYGTYRLTRNEIIQDLPLYSKEEQVFNTPGMTDAEIEESRAKLR